MGYRHGSRAWLIGAALAVVSLPGPALGQTVFESRAIVRIPQGALQGPSELLLQAEGIAAGSTDRPVVEDKVVAPTTVFAPAIEVATGDTKRRIWRVPVSISGMASAGLMLPRTAQVKFGSQAIPVEYWISNLAAPVLSWRVDGLAGEWTIPSGCHALRIAASGARATGIIVTSTLVEETTKQPLTDLYLSLDQHTPASAVALESAVNDTPDRVYLCMPADPPPGKFVGTINISAAEKPDGAPATATIHSTNWLIKSLGAVLIAIGSLLALVFRVLAPGRASRTQALLAAATLRERAVEMRSAIDSIVVPATKQLLKELIDSLQPEAMADKLPPRVPSPFGGTTAPNDDFKKFIDGKAEVLQRLGIVVAGLLEATKPGSPAPPTAVGDLDKLVPGIDGIPIADLRAKVQTILSGGPHLMAMAGAGFSEPTSQQLTLILEHLFAGTWLVWVGLTFAIGLGVLVWSNPSFGLPMDLLKCFLWGFGVPAAGQQLTNSSATTALNITLPGR